MHSGFYLFALFLFTLTSLVSAETSGGIASSPPSCAVEKPTLNSLPLKFQLEVQNNKYPEIHKKVVRFVGGFDHRAALTPRGRTHLLTFNNGKVFWDRGTYRFAAYFKPLDGFKNRRLGFMPNPENEETFIAYYGCDDEGKEQVEIRQRGIPDSWDWCVRMEKSKEWGLYIEERGRKDTGCLDVKVALREKGKP